MSHTAPSRNVLPLKCRCGAVTGAVDLAGGGVRVVCHCVDCQAYAHALFRPDVLDAHGGTEVWQTTPSQLRLHTGIQHLRCLRLSETGLFRWHTGCCGTPIGNTLSPRWPFVGVVHSFVDRSAPERDALLGPAAYVQGHAAKGDVPAHVHRTAPPALLLRVAVFLLRAALAGRRRPTPFFDADGRPVVAPRVLTVAEREAIRP